MKRISFVLLMLLISMPILSANKEKQVKYRIKKTEVKSLSQMGELDLEKIEQLKGRWIIEDSRFILQFTDHFACRIDGIRYYHYKRIGTKPSYPYIYTIVKSKQTGHYFFARGYYKNKHLFGNTSQIVFKKDYFIVYSDKNPEKVYFKAIRIKEPEIKKIEGR